MRAAVLGSPIEHSLSPALHRAAYAAAGLSWRYDRIELRDAQLSDFLATLTDDWAGLSLTMPLKVAAVELADWVDPQAQLLGVANTLVCPHAPGRGARAEGLAAYNTDVFGIERALTSAGIHEVRRGVVLGAGATARSALAALANIGAEHVTVVARRPTVAADLVALGQALGVSVQIAPWSEVADTWPGSAWPADELAVTVSTVPAGAADEVAGALSGYPQPPRGALLDVVYHPWPTALAAAWPGQVINGLEMLVWQAVAQVRLMAGIEPEVAAMRAAVGLPTAA